MKTKTKVKAGGLASNHNQTVASELPVNTAANEFAEDIMVEIENIELETIAAGLPVRSGLQAGSGSTRIIPCL